MTREHAAGPERATRVESDAEIEAIVADAIAAEAARARGEAAVPSSAIVWWRAQMRARQEAARAAERPITVVHGLAIACLSGLALSLAGTALAGLRGVSAWIVEIYRSFATVAATVDLMNQGVTLPMMATTALIATIVIVSIAAFVIFADE